VFRESLSGGFFRPTGVELGIENLEHRTAGTRGDDHGFGISKVMEGLACDDPGFIPVAGVEGGLAAAGDRFGAGDPVSQPFEDANHVHANLREAAIDEAGDEERDVHSWIPERRRRFKKSWGCSTGDEQIMGVTVWGETMVSEGPG
jgi:hypothetical protein